MTMRFVELRRMLHNGTEEVYSFDDVTIIFGPPNSSKTTLLKMIDFMFGEEDSAVSQLGPRVVAGYTGAQLDIEIGEVTHTLSRAFDRSYGRLTRVGIDGEPIAVDAFREWIMGELGWPIFEIPRGRQAQAATDTVPLTFRTLWRHMYRREDSWYSFAGREEEFHRRAVLSFFLGLAASRYSGEEFSVGEARRARERAEAELQAIDEIADETVRRVAEEFDLVAALGSDLNSLQDQTDTELAAAEQERQRLLTVMRAREDFPTRSAERYLVLSNRVFALRDRLQALSATVDGYVEAQASATGELARLERASAAVHLFAGIPVTQCPVCAQAPPESPSDSSSTGRCYLCGQAVGPDARAHRIAIEQEVLGRDQQELAEVIASTTAELRSTRLALELGEHELQELAQQIDTEERDLVAPFVTELEELNRMIGGIEQQRAAIRGLRDLEARRTRAAERLRIASSALEEAERAWALRSIALGVVSARCEIFAERMNEFLSDPGLEWGHPRVWLNPEDMTFNVGRSEWQNSLGAESRVPFFLAYHYALLHLGEDLPGDSYPPGMAVLDNPLQQGIRETVVVAGLDRIASAARRTGGQLLVALPRNLEVDHPATRISMTRTYSPDAQ